MDGWTERYTWKSTKKNETYKPAHLHGHPAHTSSVCVREMETERERERNLIKVLEISATQLKISLLVWIEKVLAFLLEISRLCVCMCVCVRPSMRGRKTDRDKDPRTRHEQMKGEKIFAGRDGKKTSVLCDKSHLSFSNVLFLFLSLYLSIYLSMYLYHSLSI